MSSVTIKAIFQSTPPIRGATSEDQAVTTVFCISIHAPHTGGDLELGGQQGGGQISIHAPHTGGDLPRVEALERANISIHAPHTGGDVPCGPS